jgi:hypothetical protein
VLTGEGGRAGDAVNVWNATRRSYDRGETRVGDHALPGELYFAWSCIQDHFAFVRRIGDYGLFHHRRALGKAWLVRGSITAKDDLEALELVRSPSFDPARLVVLSQEEESPIEATETPFDRRLLLGRGSSTIYLVCPDGRSIVPISDEIEFLVNHFSWTQVQTISKEQLASYAVVSRERAHELGARLRTVTALESGSPPPKLVEESPMWVRFEADCKAPEYLVISQAHYPGWKARVNGVEKPMLRANYAFCAVELQRGLNLVDLSYEPESFRIGLWIGLASLLVGVLCLFPRVPTD